jgi:copper(I)-binding protein
MRAFFAIACAVAVGLPAAASPAPATAKLTIDGAWSRPTPAGAPTGVGYLTIVNAGPADDRLVGAASPVASKVEVHEMSMAGGIMRMRPAPDGVPVPAGGKASLAPGGYHLMLIGPTRPYRIGDRIPVTLRFAKAGAVSATLTVGTEAPR